MNHKSQANRIGKLALFGSGETSPSGRSIHERMFSELRRPIRVAILETPAGFQPNTALVAQKVGDFLKSRLRNFSPIISIIPARRREEPFSTNDPNILSPMLEANYIFLGAGSPTYLVRHLQDTLALSYLIGRHRRGATIALASAAAITTGSRTVPVYEIFKAGGDLYWAEGLDFLGSFGLDIAVVTHWNNREGGEELDTSRCYMGQARMEKLRGLLPSTTTILGIDEHTGLIFDFQAERCQVIGKGTVTILSPESEEVHERGATFPLKNLGPYHPPPEVEGYGPPVGVPGEAEEAEIEAPEEVVELIQRREEVRQARNWPEADSLRERLAEMGWEIQDTREGPHWHRKEIERQG